MAAPDEQPGFYSAPQRALQEAAGTVPLADALEGTIVTPELDESAAAFITSRDFFFLSTVTAAGEPTVSYKGGARGFVEVVNPTTLRFPSYDGNGMFLSMGNIADTGRIGMLFIDFETPHRVRVQARATISNDPAELASFPGADLVVVATITETFVNCGRYIHRHDRVADAAHVPDAQGNAPIPAWKRIDLMQGVLPPGDAARVADEGGTIDYDEYTERVARGEP